MSMTALTMGVIKHFARKAGAKVAVAVGVENGEDVDSQFMPSSISEDYQALIQDCFRALGLDGDQIRVMVRSVGSDASGLEIYAAFIKVVQWDHRVVEMLGKMPVIEKKIDRCVRQSSMLRYSAFAGLWFRSPANAKGAIATMH